MRIAVHDYAGHPFQVELSRELASRGHDVLHLYCADIVGARGALTRRDGDPARLTIDAVTIGRRFEKYSAARRFRDERAYGRAAAARIRAFNPRVVLSANTPLLSQARLYLDSKRARRRFVYWWQDSYGIGVRRVIERRQPMLAPLLATPFEAVERWMLRGSEHVIAISEGLRGHAARWGVDRSRMSVIPNWAPLDELAPGLRENSWKEANGLAGHALVLYAGTLGLKHDPELLIALAARLRDSDARVVVVSQGPGRELLERRRRELALDTLLLLDYQPYEQLGEMLAASDVLIALIEKDAGEFSVPSKVFSYLCAGRAVVASIPAENQAAEVLRAAEAGVAVPPGDAEAFVAAVLGVLEDGDRRERLGANGRAYAVRHFDIGPITDRFEQVLRGPQSAGLRHGPLAVARVNCSLIWSHPENRGRRWRALTKYVAWQVWERTVRRPWTVPLTSTRRIRCYPHCPVTSSVLRYGLPDPSEMHFLLDVLASDDVFVDVGAHAGVYSVLASSVPGTRVVAVEPSSATFARLVENIELNAIENQVTASRVALGAHDGSARLSKGRGPMNWLVADDDESEPVDLLTVDGLLKDLEIPSVAVMKIDVEGAELDVLAGAAGTIAESRPALIVEVNDPEGVQAFADRAGYVSVAYDKGGLEPVSIASCAGRNALLVPDLDEARRRLRR